MDFSDYDRIDEQALNQVLWHAIKGPDVPMPPPVRRALLSSGGLFNFPVVDADDDDKMDEDRGKVAKDRDRTEKRRKDADDDRPRRR
jgi:hypothetical protein